MQKIVVELEDEVAERLVLIANRDGRSPGEFLKRLFRYWELSRMSLTDEKRKLLNELIGE